MKKKLFAGISLCIALCVGTVVVTIPAFIINTSVPSVGHARENLIRGEVFYGQRIALPKHALINVQLIDVTNKNELPKVIAETKIKSDNQGLIHFGIPLHDNFLEQGHKYALQARMTVGDTLWFVSDRASIKTDNKDNYYKVKLNSVRLNDDMVVTQSTNSIDRTVTNAILNSPISDKAQNFKFEIGNNF